MLPKGNLIRRIYRKLDHKFYKRHIDYIKQLAVKESFKYSSWVEDIKINIFSTLMYKPRQKRNITGATKTNMANNNYLEAQMKHQLKRRRLVIKRLNFVSSLKHCKCWTFSFFFSFFNGQFNTTLNCWRCCFNSSLTWGLANQQSSQIEQFVWFYYVSIKDNRVPFCQNTAG